MPKCYILVGPPGSGKSTLAKQYEQEGFVRVNQDSQGPEHLDIFEEALQEKKDVCVDRMNFNKEQRNRYLKLAKSYGYDTKIFVLHESFETCFERCKARENHESIKDEKAASKALNFFFTKYERVEDSEADEVVRLWPKGDKPDAIWIDLDGTLCQIEHRRHFVENVKKKDWSSFFKALKDDTVNLPVKEIIEKFHKDYKIIFCSGRSDDYKNLTLEWFNQNGIYPYQYDNLFMRRRNDFRPDNIVKEIILDFEILSRYNVFLCLDDRDQVVTMLRKRNLTVFQVADGNF